MAPLAAVLVLAGPGAAYAASPAPDASPNTAVLAPDPIPIPPRAVQASPRPVLKHAVPAATRPPRFVAVVRTPTVETVTQPPAPTPKRRVQPPKHVVKHPTPARHDTSVPIVDVIPLRVDVHRGLGAITSTVRDDSRLALAALAVLAAALAAASGAALTFVVRRPV